MKQPLIPFSKIENILQPEPALLIVGFGLSSWLIYKLFLKKVSEERHKNLQELFSNLAAHSGFFLLLFIGYQSLSPQAVGSQEGAEILQRWLPYLGLACLLSGMFVFVKAARIVAFEYLFFGHMKEGVPLLLVNLLSLLLTLATGGWLIAEIFSIQIGPVLATSAVFSVIAGMALQDTLGNLFSGVAMQFDKPYSIGDWIEVNTGGQKVVGQVQEISWRATLLVGWADELITLPNRVMGQAQIANFSASRKPIIRSLNFRLPFSANPDLVKQTLIDSLAAVPRVLMEPRPLVFTSEVADSWVLYRMIFYIEDYGAQYTIQDAALTSALRALRDVGIEPATPQILVHQANPL